MIHAVMEILAWGIRKLGEDNLAFESLRNWSMRLVRAWLHIDENVKTGRALIYFSTCNRAGEDVIFGRSISSFWTIVLFEIWWKSRTFPNRAFISKPRIFCKGTVSICRVKKPKMFERANIVIFLYVWGLSSGISLASLVRVRIFLQFFLNGINSDEVPIALTLRSRVCCWHVLDLPRQYSALNSPYISKKVGL